MPYTHTKFEGGLYFDPKSTWWKLQTQPLKTLHRHKHHLDGIVTHLLALNGLGPTVEKSKDLLSPRQFNCSAYPKCKKLSVTVQTMIQNFTFTGRHVPGIDNSITNSLSRFQMYQFRPWCIMQSLRGPAFSDEIKSDFKSRLLRLQLHTGSTRRTYTSG